MQDGGRSIDRRRTFRDSCFIHQCEASFKPGDAVLCEVCKYGRRQRPEVRNSSRTQAGGEGRREGHRQLWVSGLQDTWRAVLTGVCRAELESGVESCVCPFVFSPSGWAQSSITDGGSMRPGDLHKKRKRSREGELSRPAKQTWGAPAQLAVSGCRCMRESLDRKTRKNKSTAP